MIFEKARSYWNLKEEALHGTLRKEHMMMMMMMMMVMTAYDAVLHERYLPRSDHTVFT